MFSVAACLFVCQWFAGGSARKTTNATAAQTHQICNVAFTAAAGGRLPGASGKTATAVLHRRTSHSRRRQHHVTPSCSLPIVYPSRTPPLLPHSAPLQPRRQRLGGCCHWHCLLPRRVLQPSVQPIVTRPEHSASACARQHMHQVLCRRRHSLLHADHLLLFLLRLIVSIH